MRKEYVKIGGVYVAKVSGRLTWVRVEYHGERNGWAAIVLDTRESVHIASAGDLCGRFPTTRERKSGDYPLA